MKTLIVRHLKVVYRPEAIADLGEIYRCLALKSQNRAVAEEFVKRIKARCSRVGLVPEGGRPRDDLEPGLRTVPFEHSAVITYKVEADCVRIGNVFYGGQDYEALYRADSDVGEENADDNR